MEYADLIDDYPDFPRPGVTFKDISPLLAAPEARNALVERLVADAGAAECSHVAGIDARGFIFAALTAGKTQRPFVMIRKAGKLPGDLVSLHYTLEYGEELLELNPQLLSEGDRVLIVDDVLATGGTARTAAQLIQRTGAQVHGFAFPLEITALNGRERLEDYPITSVIQV